MASQRHVTVGGVQVGGGAPVVVQTMTKTETANLAATMDQIRRVAEAGADLVRVAVPRDKDVEALKTIVRESPIPVIADIHFNHTLALKAIDKGNAELARVEQFKKFTIVPGDWAPGGEELTPTLKLKRKPIYEKYEADIEAMYAPS